MIFKNLMNMVFQNYLDTFVIVFIDDIMVYPKNESDHMDPLRVMLQALNEHQLFSKYSKCEFLLRLVALLRHVISSEGVEVDPEKTEAVRYRPRPLNPKNIRSFLGLSGYYMRFVDSFASITSSFTTFTQMNVKFELMEAC